MGFKIFSKERKIKNKGQYIRTRHIYRIFNVPIFFRDFNTSYFKDSVDKSKRMLWGNYPPHVQIGEFIHTNPNFFQRLRNLISNLDSKEAKKILKIIIRLKECYNTPEHCIELHDIDEKKALDSIQTNFFDNILQVSENIWCYEGYFLPISHFCMNAFYHKHGMHILESSTLKKIRNKDFIDVGGFVGDSAIIFEREFCDKKIHTFEATKSNFKQLLKTLELNKSSRIIPINKGLGACESTLEISVADGSSSLKDDLKEIIESSHSEMASIITLDSYVRENNVDVGFIKVDIEGFEQEFLKGAFETISRFKPAMLISVYHNLDDFFDIKPLIQSWNLGYTFKFDKPVDGSIACESVIFCEVL
ncbi:FkbM family methyltransferase [Helicobacter saguini]|uniref:FkbM family methyltransferase n=1 Tax=Helicobacter saguini TaxID=1548018 RepID=A0A347VR59_9HELI|nr:FkbM family methyltransferase [Helicobacter saguini]MWV63024.1 FkbM family methyltransferase [Helicobacter saguini]MWV66307.1 FkbM family methyltransferase [Helicobacter saguini]MWV68659.1 FkbM family methyltransferase [Helicobacter saguini]MWV71790.1 FkbM family methyltransferase [Helicobacter saguini]TLD95818.1 FkbM family methyltransferase [Helicobacter saguini]